LCSAQRAPDADLLMLAHALEWREQVDNTLALVRDV
jgi:hypothetical protein